MMVVNKMVYPELNVRELRILDALLRERSITRTAQSMGAAQPAISKALARLRRQFSDPLFVRNGQAMQPTAKALDIAGQLHILLGAVDGLRAAAVAFDPLRSDRLFSLLLTDVGMVRFLPPLVAHVAATAPNVSLRRCPWIRARSS
jgi:DNA-binding transcriptional LysR family regulator